MVEQGSIIRLDFFIPQSNKLGWVGTPNTFRGRGVVYFDRELWSVLKEVAH
jgi:hypothetical protein